MSRKKERSHYHNKLYFLSNPSMHFTCVHITICTCNAVYMQVWERSLWLVGKKCCVPVKETQGRQPRCIGDYFIIEIML